ncbi:MAG: hypothetical protein VYB44_12850 [Bacteroidota bacterium]|nr:hypothetical protein [Bacteroidota bacterium]
MITSVVGRTFLKAYNEKYRKDFSPKEFFEEEYWQLFFNHSKYMQWVTNSPFVQMKSGQKPHLLNEQERMEKLEALYEKAGKEIPDASFALGFPASEAKDYASTSGLVSDLAIPVDEDEVYLSWIGSGLGIGVSRGFTILFDDAAITLQTYEGWKVYRSCLDHQALEKLRGNQVNTWNGQWLTYSMNPDEYDADFNLFDLTQQGIFKVDASLAEVNTVNWSQLFFSLSQQFPKSEMMGYVYGFGQTNKTIGFIPFQFKAGSTIKEVYRELFGQVTDKRVFESLFGMRFDEACKLGSIGMLALRPESLKSFMYDEKNLNFKKENEIINYQAYKTWLTAMLSRTRNKEELLTYSEDVAKAIIRYKNDVTGTERRNFVEGTLFKSKIKVDFLDHLEKVIKDVMEDEKVTFKNLRDNVHLMSNEDCKYFITLLKFDYAYYSRETN